MDEKKLSGTEFLALYNFRLLLEGIDTVSDMDEYLDAAYEDANGAPHGDEQDDNMGSPWETDPHHPDCEYCGEPIDYCPGHGPYCGTCDSYPNEDGHKSDCPDQEVGY